LVEFTGSVRPAGGQWRFPAGVINVQAVNQAELIACRPQGRTQFQETQRPGPEIIGREIVNPGVDEEGAGKANQGDILIRDRGLLFPPLLRDEAGKIVVQSFERG
jgi:hypothetical protein